MTTVSKTTTAEHGPHIITLPGGVVIDDDDLRNDTGPETHKELLLSKYSVKFRESIQSMLRSYSNIPIEALTTIYFEDYDNNRTSTFQSRVKVDDAKRTMAFLADLLGYGNMSLSTGEIIRTTMFLNDVATTTFVDLKKTDFEMIGFDLPGMVQAFIRTSNGLVDTRYNSKWNQLKDEFVGPSAVVTVVDKFTESIAHLLEKSQTIRVKSKNIQYQIGAVDTMDFLTTGWTFTAETGGALTVDDTGCEQVLVNPIDIDDSFADANDGLALVGALYNDVTGQMAKHDIKETVAEQMANDIHHNVTGTLAENLISLSVIPMSGDVSIPVSVTYCLNHHQQVGHDNVPGCAFWDFSINVANGGAWNDVGCTALETTGSYTKCFCNHTTNFAVLLQVTDILPPEEMNVVLHYMAISGCGLSVLSLLISIIIYVYLGKLNRIHRNVRINLMFAILMSYGLYLTSDVTLWEDILEGEEADWVCMGLGIASHLTFLAMTFWMFAECLFVFSNATAFFESDVKLRTYYIIGWGIPSIIVGVTAGALYDRYGGQACWLDTDGGLIWTLVGPAIMVFTVNILLLILSTRTMLIAEKMELRYKDEQKLTFTKASVKSAIFLNPVVGICLACRYLCHADVIFEYQFVVLAGLQGLLTFLFYVVWNPEVKHAMKKGQEDAEDDDWVSTTRVRYPGTTTSAGDSAKPGDVSREQSFAGPGGSHESRDGQFTRSASQVSFYTLNSPTPDDDVYATFVAGQKIAYKS